MPAMTQPWPQIVARYDDYKGEHKSISALGALAQRITQSPLAHGLHAWTSMFDLCIVQIPVSYPFDGPFLRISRAVDCSLECSRGAVRALHERRVFEPSDLLPPGITSTRSPAVHDALSCGTRSSGPGKPTSAAHIHQRPTPSSRRRRQRLGGLLSYYYRAAA